MTSSPARRLILAFGALTVPVFFLPAFTDEISYAGFQQALFGIAIDAVILWRLWHGSSAAWVLALGLDLLSLAGLVAFGPPLDLVWASLLVVGVAQFMILVSRPMRAYVSSRPGHRAVVG